MDLPEPLIASDVIVGLAGCHGTEPTRAAVRVVSEAVRAVRPDLRVAIACGSDAVVQQAREAAPAEGALVRVVPFTFTAMERFPSIGLTPTDAYRVLFSMGQRAGAKVTIMLGSDPDHLTPATVQALAQPILESGFDIVAPLYSRQVFDGLLNTAVVYPLTRALYGRRIEGQIGLDFSFSPRVGQRWEPAEQQSVRLTRQSWIIPQAVCDDFRIAQAHLDIRLPPAPEASDVGTVISQVLGSLFLDLEHRASIWQRVQRSQAVPVFGAPTAAPGRSDPVDVRPMIDSFVLAYRNLLDVWNLVLPPATLLDLKRLTLVPAERFRLPDELWARIVFDFALGHRLRALSRDHLLRALAPAYLAWVASYALEMQGATRAAADARVERLCLAFEAEKPYLVRRWRWPDRFNP